MSRCEFSVLAQDDLRDIRAYVARRNLPAARRLLEDLEQACYNLADFPGKGRARPELLPGLRSIPVGDYLIIYREIEDGVEIARVFHGARNLEALFKQP